LCPNKDGLVLQQRRFVILNHEEVLEREIEKMKKKKTSGGAKAEVAAEKKRKLAEEVAEREESKCMRCEDELSHAIERPSTLPFKRRRILSLVKEKFFHIA
jgi:hypothetical protein